MLARTEIRSVERPTRREFLDRWFRAGEPLLITGLMRDWPAFGKWTPEFFERIGEGKSVRIEFGNVLQENPRFTTWSLGRYLRHIRGEGTPSDGGVAVEEGVPYLAYFDIFAT